MKLNLNKLFPRNGLKKHIHILNPHASLQIFVNNPIKISEMIKSMRDISYRNGGNVSFHKLLSLPTVILISAFPESKSQIHHLFWFYVYFEACYNY